MKLYACVLFSALLATAVAAQYDCSVAKYSFVQGGSTIGVRTGSGWPPGNDGQIQEAVSRWSTSCSGYAGAFPQLGFNIIGAKNATVNLHVGNAPPNVPNCGMNTPLTDSSGIPFAWTIDVWTNDRNGVDCSPVQDVITHELGHTLGLADVSYAAYCYGSIMGSRNPGETRTIRSDDCQQVDANWQTSTETPPPPPPPPLTVCDPGHPGCDNGISIEPLILDLNGDGIHTTSIRKSPIHFDADSDGRAELMGWTNSSTEEAFLFYDRNHNRLVDGVAELFSDLTVGPDGRRALTGAEALQKYDLAEFGGNGDQAIDPGDRIWGVLRLWVDRNHNGVAEIHESYPLAAAGVLQINLDFRRLGVEEFYGIDPSGNWHPIQGTFVQRVTEDGRVSVHVRAVHDVYFLSAR